MQRQTGYQCRQLLSVLAVRSGIMFKFVTLLVSALYAVVVSLDGAAGRKLSDAFMSPLPVLCGEVGSTCCSNGSAPCGADGVCCDGICFVGACPAAVRSLLHCSLSTSICVSVSLMLNSITISAFRSLLSGIFVLVSVVSCIRILYPCSYPLCLRAAISTRIQVRVHTA
jgi:hypothetical protein